MIETRPAAECEFDIVALGEVMLRLDPGEGRVRTARRFEAWEGGGEYNVARGMRKVFGLRAGVVTALADNEIGRLVENLVMQGGVDTSLIQWEKYDGIGRNVREADADPTGHAEVVALREAARARGEWRLTGCTLVVTLEPCTMCAGAAVLARVDRVVFGAFDPKAGAVGSLWDVVRDRRLNRRPEVLAGVLADESEALLDGFFRAQRG